MKHVKKDQWNKLLKIRILKQGKNQWELRCVSDKNGSQVRKGEIVFRGSEDQFKLLLRRLKASDTETTPAGTKNITYQKMIDLSNNPKGNYIYVKTKNWNEYKNGKQLTLGESIKKVKKESKVNNKKENKFQFEKGKKVMKKNIIEIQKEVKIGNVILEKGDKIKIVNESTYDEENIWEIEISLRDTKKAIDILHDTSMDEIVEFTSTNSFIVNNLENYEEIISILDNFNIEYFITNK